MGANSAISWTHHTFNIAWGCTKVSPACANCYAESHARRFGTGWGPDAERRVFDDAYWVKPLAWDRRAAKLGERHRVFCSSMADVFEDHPTIAAQRVKLWPLIRATPNLDWLLLTKRPENILPSLAAGYAQHFDYGDRNAAGWLYDWHARGQPPSNVWLGVTAENQEWAEKRIPHLLAAPAKVRFLSCEPLLGPVVLRMPDVAEWPSPANQIANGKETCDWRYWMARDNGVSWVIAGTESGAKHRDASLDWVRSLRDQCKQGGVPFFVKQLPSGGPKPFTDPSDFPEDLRIQEVPNEPMRGAVRHLASPAVQQRA